MKVTRKRLNEGLFDKPFSVSGQEKAAQRALKKQLVNPVNPNLPEVGEVWTWKSVHVDAPTIKGLREFCKVVRYPATVENPVMDVEEGAGCVLGVARHPEKNKLLVFSLGLQISKKYEDQKILIAETTLDANEEGLDKTLSEEAHALVDYIQKYMRKNSKDGVDFGYYEFQSNDTIPWGRFFISFTEKGEQALEDLNYYLTIKNEKPTLSDGFSKGIWGDVRLQIVRKETYDKEDIVWGTSEGLRLTAISNAPTAFSVRKNEFPELFGLKESTSRGIEIQDIAFDYGYDLGRNTINSESDICTDDLELRSLYEEYGFVKDVFVYFRRGYKRAADDWLIDNQPLDECDNLNESEEQTYCPICRKPCGPYELDYYGMCSICKEEDCPEDEFDPFEEAEFYESKKKNAKIRIAEAKVRIAEAELKALKKQTFKKNLNETLRSPYRKFTGVNSKTGESFEAFYRTKTELINSTLVGRNPEITNVESLPQVVDELLAKQYPFVVDAWGSNDNWNYDVFTKIQGKLGWAIGNKCGTYIVRDANAVKQAITNIPLQYFHIQPGSTIERCVGKPIFHDNVLRFNQEV